MDFENNEDKNEIPQNENVEGLEKKAMPDTPENEAREEEARLMLEAETASKLENDRTISEAKDAEDLENVRAKIFGDIPEDMKYGPEGYLAYQALSENDTTEPISDEKLDSMNLEDTLAKGRAKGVVIEMSEIGTDSKKTAHARELIAQQKKRKGEELYAAADEAIAKLNAKTPERTVDSSKIPIEEILNMTPEEIMDLSNEVIENLSDEERLAIRKKLGTL